MEHVQLLGRPLALPMLVLLGILIVMAFYFGRASKRIKLPSLIGFMVVGVILGPSVLGLVPEGVQSKLAFIPQIALGFVAVSIGLELNIKALRRLGSGIVWIIIAESFGAFVLVTAAVFALTRDWPLSLIFGSIAPASAPAGTVAVIQEYRARGSMTKALYAILGFDDGLCIIIFGFCATIARLLLEQQTGAPVHSLWHSLLVPLQEIGLSIGIGLAAGWVFSLLARRLKQSGDVMVLLFGFVFLTIGLSEMLHLSLILTNMVVGMVVVNTQAHTLLRKIEERLPLLMPLLFVLFFTLAGASLYLAALPSLGLLGLVYVLARSAGLIGGSRLGALFGQVEDKIRKWVGLGILSQAGVAIGLSLIVKQTFVGMGEVVEISPAGEAIHSGDILGATVITTITATCIVFEIIGPILARVALTKAGEIPQETLQND